MKGMHAQCVSIDLQLYIHHTYIADFTDIKGLLKSYEHNQYNVKRID